MPKPRRLPAGAVVDLRRSQPDVSRTFFRQSVRPIGRDRLAAEPGVALAQGVLEPDLQRIEAEPVGDVVDLALAGERCLRIAEAAEGGETELVGVGHAAMAAAIRNPIGSSRHQQRVAEHARAVVGEGAAVHQQLDLAGDECPVALDAGANADLRRVPRPHHLEILFARQDAASRADR